MTRDPRRSRGDREDDRPFGAARLRAHPTGRGTLPTTRGVIEEVVAGADAPLAPRDAVAIEIDVPATLPLPADRDGLRGLLSDLLRLSIDAVRRDPLRGRRGSGVTITAVRCPETVEIEVADSGPGAGDDPGVLAEIRRRAVLLGGSFHVADCPEGGTAFTVSFPAGRVAVRRAA